MAYTNVIALERAEAKIEAVRGVAETTMTRKLYPIHGGLVVTETKPVEDEPEQTGTYHAHTTPAFGLAVYRINYEETVTYEDIAWWLQMALKGGVAGVTTGSTPAGYTYTFVPDGASDTISTFTLVAGHTGNIYKFSRCAINRLTLRWNQDQAHSWRMTAEIWARDMTPGAAFNGALADRARERVLARGTVVYVDEPAGAIGATPVTGLIRSGSITIDNQLEDKAFSEDETSVSADFARGEQLVTAELVREFKTDDEWAKMRAATTRKIRIQRTGPNIGATPTTDKRARFDIPVAVLMSPSSGYQGQNKVQTFGVMGYVNPTNVVPINAAIVNALASLPL